MLKLYGFPTSSYYSMVKLVLLEKELEFEEIHTPLYDGKLQPPPGYLDLSPIGKVPSLETPQGPLSETSVIFDYLEDLSGPAFYPADAYDRAKVREMIKYIELYLELPARRLYGEFFSRPAADEVKEEVRALLESGFNALTRLAGFDPYLMGTEISYADIFGLFALTSVTRTTKAIYGWDTFNSTPGLRAMIKTLEGRATTRRLMAERTGIR